jgi:hypothetical protein
MAADLFNWIFEVLTAWLKFFLRRIVALGRWARKPSMNKLLMILVPASVYTWWSTWSTEYVEVSSLPLALMLSFSLCGAFYLIDRVGFSKVDTISILNQHPRIYAIYMAIYAGLVLAGHWLGLVVFAQ